GGGGARGGGGGAAGGAVPVVVVDVSGGLFARASAIRGGEHLGRRSPAELHARAIQPLLGLGLVAEYTGGELGDIRGGMAVHARPHVPQTSAAVWTTSRSFASWSSKVRAVPRSRLAEPPRGLMQSRSSGTYREARSILRCNSFSRSI